jgi:hypothetical protein
MEGGAVELRIYEDSCDDFLSIWIWMDFARFAKDPQKLGDGLGHGGSRECCVGAACHADLPGVMVFSGYF